MCNNIKTKYRVMNKRNQLTIRMLRGVMLLMTMLLVPIGAWAEDYGLTVAGVQVTDANAASITSDNITGTVTFDAASNTLTLSGAEINGEITYNGTSDLTIAFSGTNTVSTSETSAIQYGGSESDRAKLTFSSTNGTLTINGESIEGFSDVDFGSLNLASISAQGVYYDKEDLVMRGYGPTPSDLTITTETYYPIWIYDPSLSYTGYSHTQLRRDSTVTVGGGTVSFDGDHTITISNINFNYEGNALVVVGPSMPALTVDLVGQSTATSGCTVLSLWDTTALTFTTDASTPGSITGYDIVSWIYSGNGQIAYENGLRAFYDADKPYQKTISTTGTYIKIGNTPVSATGDINTAEGTAYFDATSNTLTLTEATIGEQGAETSTDIQVLVDDLTIEISGTNSIYGNITYNGSNYQSSNIQINKASSAESASLTATNVNGFSGCTWGDGLYLSAHDGQGATIDVHYEHFEGEGGTMQSYYGEEIADVTFSTEETNAIWVAGNMSTGGEITGTGITGTVTYNDGVLTLNNASLSTSETIPLIVCNGDLTVELVGSDNTVYFNGDYSTYVLKNNGATGTLTFTGEGELNITSEFYEGTYKGLCDGFSTVNFNDNLGLFNRSGSKSIENITGHAPSFYVDNGTSYWQTNKGLLLNATYYYKIDYVDDTIEGSGEEVSLATDETNWGFGGASLDISNLAGPCTITAYVKLNGNTIGSNKAKLFGSNPSPFRLVYGADPVDLVLAPAIEEDDGISINGIEANVTYNSETGKISSETLGSFGGTVAMSSEGTAILNNYFTMNFEVVPPAPTIVFDETKEYLNTDVVSITMPEVLAEDQNARIMYSWVEDCEDGNGSNYTDDSKVTLTAGTGTLYAWVRYNSGTSADDALYSERVSQVFTVKTDISNAYIPEFTTRATYTGSAIVPEVTVYDSEKTMNVLDAASYAFAFQQVVNGEPEDVEAMVNAGTYVVSLVGKGAYGGSIVIAEAFEVVQATPTITFAQESYPATLGEEFTSPATVDDWDVTPWASSNADVATVKDGVITINGIGTTTITVFFAGDENHLSTSASYQLVVSRALEVAFVGSNSWASYYATENLALPEGLTAYIVSDVNETTGVVTVQSVSYIPADNGVLLQRADGGDADGYVAAPYTGTTSTFTNLLGGSTNATNISSFNDTPVYVLYNDKFKRATSGTIPARRAYLPLAVASAGAPQLMTLNVVDGDITAIRTLAADDNDGNWYTLDGFKLSGKPQHKGLYIKNGKKVFFNNK